MISCLGVWETVGRSACRTEIALTRAASVSPATRVAFAVNALTTQFPMPGSERDFLVRARDRQTI